MSTLSRHWRTCLSSLQSSKFTEEAGADFLVEHEERAFRLPKPFARTEAVAPLPAAQRAAGGGGVIASRRQKANQS